MKALILAAGYGTRLRPYTDQRPKALFPIEGRPVIDRLIRQLAEAGCRAITVNTHHLGNRVAEFLSQQSYPIPIQVRHEPEILGTGGAIKNVEDFWDDRPFLVVNSDIVTNVDFRRLYAVHGAHSHPATLVLHDDATLNSVQVNSEDFITGFSATSNGEPLSPGIRQLTFTGIQVLDPGILPLFPRGEFSSSIDAYLQLMHNGEKIRAWIPENIYWKDVGTPDRYREAVVDQMAPEAFAGSWPDGGHLPIFWEALAGDGSDRQWYRLNRGNRSLILVDHGIRNSDGPSEADAFIDIGRHLRQCTVPVPEILAYDRFAGVAILEDLGDQHLQQIVMGATPDEIITLYERVIAAQIHMGLAGAKGFDPGWAFQTPAYDAGLVMEKECRYFIDTFVNGYLHLDVDFGMLQDEFEQLAGRAAGAETIGFLHRDCQSRNIMVHDEQIFFIDFQGGRQGPLAYDVASLVIDPYVALPVSVRHRLIEAACRVISEMKAGSPKRFRRDIEYCALARNLQILGAFGFLTLKKGKPFFRNFIPTAVRTLGEFLSGHFGEKFPKLRMLHQQIEDALPTAVDGIETASKLND